MKIISRGMWTVMLLLLGLGYAGAVSMSESEFAAARAWAKNLDESPYVNSFTYDGKPSATLLPGWTHQVKTETQAGKEIREGTFMDPSTHLEVRTETTLYHDFPTVEWVVYLKNGGSADSPLLEAIEAIDAPILLGGGAPATLHWARGAVASFDDFAPQTTALKPGSPMHLQPGGGRSSNQVMPFFNVEGGGRGVIAAVGWSGEWAAEFSSRANGEVRMKSGMAQTHLRLHPGEEIRTPRIALLFYEGDFRHGQNLWRQFVLTHARPDLDGKPLVAPITCGNWGGTSAAVHLDNIRKIIRQVLPIDYYWIDAEWFGGTGSWAVNVGNWEVKKDLYPNGFKPLSQALNATGRHLMLWFEPERVYMDTPWYREHHDWLIDLGKSSSLYNLGIPEARRFLTDFLSARIDEFGLGCYRQDFNIDPLPFWQHADAPDRVGMTEIRHVEGLYAFWDELRQRHPGLLIDNCASGGRRIDLETIRRSTPFWRTDGPRDAIAHQCHTLGLLSWVPLSSTSQDRARDDYEFRSSMCSALCLNWWVAGDVPAENIPEDFPYDWAKTTLEQYLNYRKYYYGDFYPLFETSQSRDVWMAYQLDRPDLGEGMVVVLKRPHSPYRSAALALQGLDEQARYQLIELDGGRVSTLTGAEGMQQGITVTLEKTPDSALLIYKRMP